MKRKTYKQVLEMNETSSDVKTNLQAIVVLSHLGNPCRELFSDYFEESGKSSPAPLLGSYLSSRGVSSIGLRMGLQTKELILEGLRTSKHKTAMLGAVGQAHLDLCMAVAISQYCQPDSRDDLPYGEYLTLANKAIDGLCQEIETIQKTLGGIDSSYYQGDLKLIFELTDSKKSIRDIAQQRIQTAVDIILLWNQSKIEYDEEYSDIEKHVKQKAKEQFEFNQDMNSLSFIYCVQQNRNKFTEKEIAVATTLFSNCSQKSVKEFKRNPVSSSIEEARRYLVDKSNSVSEKDIEKFVKEAQKKEAKLKEKEQQIKQQLAKSQSEKEAIEQSYQNTLADWVKQNSAYLAIGYDIVQSENKDKLITEEPFDFLKSLIRDVSREVDLTKLDCPEQIDDKFSGWCISTVMPRRSK